MSSAVRRLARGYASWLLALLVMAPAATAGGGQESAANNDRPTRLWINDADWPRRRDAVMASRLRGLVHDTQRVLGETGHLSAGAALAALPDSRADILYRLQALTVRAAMLGDQAAAAEALGWVEGLLADRRGSDLGRSHAAFHASVAYAFCREHWSAADGRRVAASFGRYGLGLRAIGEGNPDDPLNNWWGVTHSAIGLCLLVAAEGDASARTELRQETDRVASYLTNYGDAGHYYEGTGYGIYGFSFWGPFLLACESTLGIDLARHAPGARRLGVCTHLLTAPASPAALTGGEGRPRVGRRVFWNDDSDRFPAREVACLFAAIAPPAERTWLEAANEHLFGADRPWRMVRGHGHAMWPLLYAPLGKPTSNYGDGAPRVLLDGKTGLAVFRNRWRDADDTILAVYAKASPGGGHQHEDAGSFRLLSLGESWATAGGQAQPAGRYQNVPLLAGTQQPVVGTGAKTGQIVYFADGPSGGSVSVDLSALYGVARCRRHFAVEFAPMAGVEVLLSVWDEIIDRSELPRWSWPLCYDRSLRFEPAGAHAFLLNARGGSSLRVELASPERVVVRDQIGEPSQRTYSEGLEVDYPASRYALVEAPDAGRGFFAVLTVARRGEHPAVTPRGTGYGRTVRVGETRLVRLEPSRWFHGPLKITRSNTRSD